jgi:hypothetical protein
MILYATTIAITHCRRGFPPPVTLSASILVRLFIARILYANAYDAIVASLWAVVWLTRPGAFACKCFTINTIDTKRVSYKGDYVNRHLVSLRFFCLTNRIIWR